MAGPLALANLDEMLRLFAMLYACAGVIIAVVAAIGLLAMGAYALVVDFLADITAPWAGTG